MKTLVILNDPPYGTERCYNGLRLAASIARKDGEEVRVFLMGDAASCATRPQGARIGLPRHHVRETIRPSLTAD